MRHGCRGHEREPSDRVRPSVSPGESPRRHSGAVRGKETLELSKAVAMLTKSINGA